MRVQEEHRGVKKGNNDEVEVVRVIPGKQQKQQSQTSSSELDKSSHKTASKESKSEY